MDNFPDALDRLISKWKDMGCTPAELARALRLAANKLGELTPAEQAEALDGN